MRVNIIGGGAAGFFTAVNLKEMRPDLDVIIIERGSDTLRKVAVSGGGRCNVTNSFEGVDDLAEVYPRGHRLLRKLFHSFGPKDIKEWFETRGVRLVEQADHCIFPASQNSQTIINCLCGAAIRLGVEIRTSVKDFDIDAMLANGEQVVICTGGITSREMPEWLPLPDTDLISPVPSLFSLSIKDERLCELMGTVAEGVTASLAGHKIKAQGDLLITHWGVSGPAILRLSSYAARILAECGYKGTLVVNWLGESEDETREKLQQLQSTNPQKNILNARPPQLSSRLWEHIVYHCLPDARDKKWCAIGKKDMNKLVQGLSAATYAISGRAPFKDEFVTAGGISLSTINPNTMESRRKSGLYFAGEVTDIDGVTGGFNFTAAWCTAMAAARAIAAK
ncbi:MAG: aminoacetone oxidase family FAD-binding enzyme [Marinilabiliaceae bacterium]